ncbi:MAG: histone deacetylase [Acidimicrobiia bacterium]|nr:histone deacetylase [Acidimicrobiia bacterium]
MADVWYVAYGSNLWSRRLACYLAGGTAPGSTRANRGARDPKPPKDHVAFDITGRVVFAQRSSTWVDDTAAGSGVAFVDVEARGVTPARAWRVTAEQFDDVFAQENGGTADGAARAHSGGWYGRVIRLDDIDGLGAYTFTCTDVSALEVNRPAPAYLVAIARGYAELHDWSASETARYLAPLAGVAETYTASELHHILDVHVTGTG